MPGEFDRLLRQAYDRNLTEPLLQYVEQHELAEDQRRQFTSWVRHVLGRATGPPWPPTVEHAAKNAAWLVEFKLSSWRRQNPGQVRPRSLLPQIISESITETARDLGVPETLISEADVRRERKTGRIKVPTP
jgi:hypothetical protein